VSRARGLALATAALVLLAAGVAGTTCAYLPPLPRVLPGAESAAVRSQLTDRAGRPLSVTYENAWNLHDVVAFHEVPPLLREAFVQAEDQRFYRHGGVDWIARAHAALQNLRAGRVVRGASTISEQSVRMLEPRPRTLWSRWIEGIQAGRLEARFSKAEILAFYLNQVPYARQRRGVAQAARDYFDRDLDTLAPGEMLALAVLVRSPVRLDLVRGTRAIEAPLMRLAERMHRAGALSARELGAVDGEGLALTRPAPPVAAAHFVRFVRTQQAVRSRRPARVTTTLDAALQERVQRLLDRRVERLRGRGVGDGAALVVDHHSGEILAWVDAGRFEDSEGGQIDAVLAPRQPGSTLKPLLYAMALEKGWSAATLVEDAPLADAVGHGLHHYRNYSRNHYGPLRVRLALGNSLNVPAVRAIRFVGRGDFLERLRGAGVTSLRAHPDHYGDGLALGNGEVALLELVHAYATLARGGRFEPLRWRVDPLAPRDAPRRVYDPEVSALIADILSDPEARELEFGRGGLLDFPVQTAVKTGTSNDYRDAWALGFSHRFTAGVWMGNLDRRPMQDVTGSRGPALVLRAIFAELHRYGEVRPLPLSRRLEDRRICRSSGLVPGPHCPIAHEWFRPGHAPREDCPFHDATSHAAEAPPGTSRVEVGPLRLASPTPGLHLAMDPRIPDSLERFPLRLAAATPDARIDWLVDGRVVGTTSSGRREFLWPLTPGMHTARAQLWPASGVALETDAVQFVVK
jgi:penicillin-binding protein 1C